MKERKLNRVSSLAQLKVDVTRTRNFRRVSSTDVQAKPRPREYQIGLYQGQSVLLHQRRLMKGAVQSYRARILYFSMSPRLDQQQSPTREQN